MSEKRQTESEEREKERFFVLTEALIESTHPEEQKRLKEELARRTFGH
jgi:hypothetical protein